MNKKHLALGLNAVGISVILTACGGGGSTTPPPVEAPSKPTNVVATAKPGFVQITWQSDGKNVQGFAIYRETIPKLQQSGVKAQALALLASVDKNVRSFNDTTAAAGTQYRYAVAAKGSQADSDAASTGTVTAQPGESTKEPIKGKVGFFDQGLNAAATERPLSQFKISGQNISPDVIPGRIIVKYREGSSLSKQGVLKAGGKTLTVQRALAVDNARLLSFESNNRAETAQVLAALKNNPEVEYAQPDIMMYPMKTPNDPLFGLQWHYNNINLPATWDITTGTNVTVAVLDTGIIKNHPDFAGKLLPGYDFVTLTANTPTGDGNGRDPDPEDNGDLESTSYHGAHVAGTIAAATNNGAGVAGVSWGAKIVPVRVLGLAGGSLSDIMDALLWAGGEAVAGVPANANPAKVINMSLGGMASCADLPAYQAVFDKLAAKGIITVVAAGNSNMDASNFAPASCGNVITVGSTGLENDRSTFSNFGARIDVMAPGGQMSEDRNGDGHPDGVLSISKNDNDGSPTNMFLHGTSMASPHVAGVVALMKSVNPNLNYAQALKILQDTATPLTSNQCRINNACGAGLINALKAVQASNTAPAADFNVVMDDPVVTLEPGATTSANLHLNLTGGFNQPIGVALEGVNAKLQASVVALGNNKFRIDVAALAASDGNYTITVKATSGDKIKTEVLNVQVKPSVQNVKGVYVIACALTNDPDNICDNQASTFVQLQDSVKLANYTVNVEKQHFYIPLAWLDKNKNEELDNGDYWAFYLEDGELVLVEPGATGIDLPLELYQENSMQGMKASTQSKIHQIIKEMVK